MELTGARRTVHIMLFATLAWASYFVLVMWSWHGGTSFNLDSWWHLRSSAFYAGNALTVFVALAALVIVAGALRTPTLERARRACWMLFALIPVTVFELAVWYVDVEQSLPTDVVYTSSGIATRTAMAMIGLSGIVLIPTIGYLFALERRHRARGTIPTARVAGRFEV
jgi:hypothetical protein